MAESEKKGVTVKIDAMLHAEVREYLDRHAMTMAEFVAMAFDDELHPKIQMKGEKTMEKTRTLAFQVPEELFQRIKEYLQRNNLTQRDFVIGLIEDELRREQDELTAESEAVSGGNERMEEESDEHSETAVTGSFEPDSDADDLDLFPSEAGEDGDPDETESENIGFGMTL